MKSERLASLAFGLLYVAYGVWLASHPPSLGSDDALYFTRAVDHFSVIEFSPHFPGYPGFVAWSRLLNLWFASPLHAVSAASLIAALAIPGTLYLLIAPRSRSAAAFAGTLALFQPLLPSLGLGMLSDAAGLELVLLHLLALDRGRARLAAVVLAAAMLTRPSYAVLGLAAWASVYAFRRSQIRTFSIAFVGVVAPAVALLFCTDGFGYASEGLRFVHGHLTIWGNASSADRAATAGWLEAARSATGLGPMFLLAGLALFAALARLDRDEATASTLAVLLFSYLLWMIGVQNPENLRHLAPPVFLAVAIAGLACARVRAGGSMRAIRAAQGLATTAALAGFLLSVDLQLKPSPLHRLSAEIATLDDPLVATNHGVDVLREAAASFAVMDAYYGRTTDHLTQGSHARRGSSARSILRVSSTPISDARWAHWKTFRQRWPGERSLSLYERVAPASQLATR